MASVLDPAAVLIGLREGLEACLVTGILLGMMKRFGHPRQARMVWVGAAAGVLVSVALALLVQLGIAGFQQWYTGQGGEPLVEVVTGTVALAILVYMVIWMQRHTSQMVGGLHTKVVDAVAAGRWSVIASLAFFVIVREGIETVLFFAARQAETSWGVLALSGCLGLAASVLLAYGIFRLSVRINFERFFVITGYLLIFLAAGLLVGTVHAGEELGEIRGWWTPTPFAWDTSGVLPDSGHWLGNVLHVFLGYVDHPSLAQVVAYVLFVGGVGGWYAYSLRPRRPATPSSDKAA